MIKQVIADKKPTTVDVAPWCYKWEGGWIVRGHDKGHG